MRLQTLNRGGVYLLFFLLNFCVYAQSQVKKSDTTTVYTTKTGSKYHLETCRYLKYSQIKTQIGLASKEGYTACSVCKPGISSTVSKSSSNSTVPVATARQCTATTQKGTRCKRTTKNASGKCWQHE